MINMQWRALSQVFCNSMSTMDNACKWNVTEKRGGGELSEAQKNKKCCGSLALWQKIPPVLKFCNSMIFSSGNSTKNHHCTGSWAKQRLRAAGLDTQVLKVSGNVSAPGKSKAMDNFRAGWELIALYCTPTKIDQNIRNGGLLFCTDVCSMGLDVPELVIGVSLGTLDTHFIAHTSPFNVFI